MDFINKAKGFLDQHDEQVDQALDKAGDFAKTRFAGHDQHIDQAVDKAQEFTGQGDTTRPAAPPAEAPIAPANHAADSPVPPTDQTPPPPLPA